tara:strand:- start:147 stop:860 length:714 start_codon:yes stop_codon:yes gene_type:complete
MRVGIGISMFDEHELVLRNIQTIKEEVSIDPYFVVVHSDDGNPSESLETIKSLVDRYTQVSDMSTEFPNHFYQARCVSRNFSKIFSNLYTAPEMDYYVAFTGDTLVTDSNNFNRLHSVMKDKQKVACVSQAIGQRFHASTDNLKDRSGNRYQHDRITDFMPQLFLLEGQFATSTKCFSHIEVTNELTSEQCLGDELLSHIDGDFHEKVYRLNYMDNSNAYAYNDGVVYHARNGKPGR